MTANGYPDHNYLFISAIIAMISARRMSDIMTQPGGRFTYCLIMQVNYKNSQSKFRAVIVIYDCSF